MTKRPAPAFGERLRRYRTRAGLTQEALAERAGLTAATISALERGVRRLPYPHTRLRLAEALDLSEEERAAFVTPRPEEPSAQDTAPALFPAPPTNLPVPRTPLIGREREVAALRELILHDPARLVTLTGLGGGGKTRLAVAVATEMQTAFPDGVWLVELASTADPAMVPQTVAAALGVPETPGVTLVESVIAFLKPRSLLLVLDNCEHVIDACAQLAERLLSACPELRILATSRESLQIAGERPWRVPPLSTPDPDQRATPDALAAYPAVQLFVARAQAIAPEFRLTAENAETVARICARLDGIPLALELAAVRVPLLAPEQILTRLDDSLHLLTGGSRAAPSRQQTLRAALDWSHDLLTSEEQTVFHRLAVFAGGCDLEAIEAVASPESAVQDSTLDAGLSTLDYLARLVDKSLVLVDRGEGAPRYRLLEPVRQYAVRYLAAGGDAEIVGARHAAYYRDFAERAAPELCGPEQVAWLARLDREGDNLRAALRWTAVHDVESGLRIAGALVRFWEVRGFLSEGRGQLAAMLAAAREHTAPSQLWLKALIGAGSMAQWQVDLEGAELVLNEALALSRALGEEHRVAESLAWLGTVQMRQAAFPAAAALLEESLDHYRNLDEPGGVAFALLTLGVTVGNDGDLARSHVLLEESLNLYRQLGDVRYIAITLTMLGAMTRITGDLSRALLLLEEAHAGHRAVGDRTFLLENVLQFAGVAIARGEAERAARLLGVRQAGRDALGVALEAVNSGAQQLVESQARARLGDAGFEAAWRSGLVLSMEQAVAEELRAVRHGPSPIARPAPVPAPAPPEPITAREREVARLLAQGYSDRQIADALTISVRTVGVHVQHLLAKLDLRSRWQVADWATANGLAERTPR